MRLRIVCVGGVKGSLAEVVSDYEKRCGHYWRFEVVEVTAGTKGRAPSPEAIREAEGVRVEAALSQDLTVWLLTRNGGSLSSAGLAKDLEDMALRSEAGVNFVIGGAFGVAGSLVERASRAISLSSLTIPHEIARLLLTEQIYRAGTILRGEPYHKGPGGKGNLRS